MRIEITDVLLRTLRPPARGLELFDTIMPGLSLRIASTGTCTWSVRARLPNGDRPRTSPGRWPTLSIRDARRIAKIAMGQLATGTNPNDTKRAGRAATRARKATPTVSERLAEWQADKAPPHWSQSYAHEVASYCAKRIEPKLGNRPLVEITRADWIGLVRPLVRRTPAVAAWLWTTVCAFNAHSEASGWIEVNPLPRRATALIAPRVPSRFHKLSDQELVAVWRAADTFGPKVRAFLHLLLATGFRVSEASHLPAGEVDFMRGVINLSGARTKNRQPRPVPLHPLLLVELQAIWPSHPTRPGYKLFGRFRGSGLSGISEIKRKLDEASGVTGWRMHDIRRTVRSGLSALGVPSLHAELALGHVSSRTQLERLYDQHDYRSEVLTALSTWQAHLAELVTAGATDQHGVA
jgi:integrase